MLTKYYHRFSALLYGLCIHRHTENLSVRTQTRGIKKIVFIAGVIIISCNLSCQSLNPNKDIFPNGTVMYGNIPYANDTLKQHMLDIYLPDTGKSSYPLIVWIHGGGWRMGDKYGDMGYMKHTVKEFIQKGYAIASIDYRWSTKAIFPAQIQDCNRAVEFLFLHASKYKLDKDRIGVIGFSAGGHLASLLGLSNNNQVDDFYYNGKKPEFKISLVLDFCGPSNFLALTGDYSKDPKNGMNILLGGLLADRLRLAKEASPVTYIDKNDPAVLIVHGEKDELINPNQSISLGAALTKAGVKNELIIVRDAPHVGYMFDTENIRKRVFYFSKEHLK
jgi:acetyl esterase/lipase